MSTKDFIQKYKSIFSVSGIEFNIGAGKNHIANSINQPKYRKIGAPERKKIKSLFYQMFIDFQKITD